MKTITYEWLRRHGACEDQRDLAALHFGRSAPLTRQTLVEAAALGLDVDWLAVHMGVWDAYRTAHQPLWDAYRTAHQPLWDAYQKARQPLWDAYRKAHRPLWDAYQTACADAIADLLGLP